MSGGRVLFVGCGPGAADLLTLRGARALSEADVVIWGRSLLPEAAVSEHLRPGAEVVAWPPATEHDVLAVYARARDEGLAVVRLKGGDPGLFGALEPELGSVRELGLAWEVVPGVSAVSAAAAALGREASEPGRPLLLTAAADAAAGAEPDLGVFMPGRDPHALARDLAARGLPPGAGCVLACDVSRPGELIVRCRLDELAERVSDLDAGGRSLVLVRATEALGVFCT